MSNDFSRAHDLAVAAAAITAHLNFDTEATGDTPDERRASFANYLEEEYEFFLCYYQSVTK